MFMPKTSAGILLYRFKNNEPEYFLVHPGGPFWAKKDMAAWSVPKGEFDKEETAEQAARREFYEETGVIVIADLFSLTPVKQSSGKTVYAFAAESDIDASAVKSNFFEMEWPPRSGKKQSFPEIDKAGWFTLKEAKEKIVAYQAPLLEELHQIIQNKDFS